MAVTAEQIINSKTAENERGLQAYPVASGETIYKGTFAGVQSADGLLYDLDAAAISAGVVIVGVVADGSANADGPAATTAAGSISGSLQESSAVAGDKTVRRLYTKGSFELTGSGFTQADVGQPIYASDNYTVTTTSASNQWIGTCVSFISATKIWVELNDSKAI